MERSHVSRELNTRSRAPVLYRINSCHPIYHTNLTVRSPRVSFEFSTKGIKKNSEIRKIPKQLRQARNGFSYRKWIIEIRRSQKFLYLGERISWNLLQHSTTSRGVCSSVFASAMSRCKDNNIISDVLMRLALKFARSPSSSPSSVDSTFSKLPSNSWWGETRKGRLGIDWNRKELDDCRGKSRVFKTRKRVEAY